MALREVVDYEQRKEVRCTPRRRRAVTARATVLLLEVGRVVHVAESAKRARAVVIERAPAVAAAAAGRTKRGQGRNSRRAERAHRERASEKEIGGASKRARAPRVRLLTARRAPPR